MIETLPHLSPATGCTCVVCEAVRRERLRALSSAQRRCLAALDWKIPRHVDDLRAKGVRWQTLASLMTGTRRAPALVLRLDLRRAPLDAPYYTFALLTRDGRDHVATGRKMGVVA